MLQLTALGALVLLSPSATGPLRTRAPRSRARLALAGGDGFFGDTRAQRAGVAGAGLKIATFDGIRGVEALEPLDAGARVLAVPAPNALQVRLGGALQSFRCPNVMGGDRRQNRASSTWHC